MYSRFDNFDSLLVLFDFIRVLETFEAVLIDEYVDNIEHKVLFGVFGA